MPKYIIEDTDTSETSEFWGSYDEMKAHVDVHENLRVVVGCPQFISGKADNMSKVPDGFKDKLRDIKKKHPGATGMDHII